MKTLLDTGLLPKEKKTLPRGLGSPYNPAQSKIDGFNSALSQISSIPISKILDWAIKNGLVGVDVDKILEENKRLREICKDKFATED